MVLVQPASVKTRVEVKDLPLGIVKDLSRVLASGFFTTALKDVQNVSIIDCSYNANRGLPYLTVTLPPMIWFSKGSPILKELLEGPMSMV